MIITQIYTAWLGRVQEATQDTLATASDGPESTMYLLGDNFWIVLIVYALPVQSPDKERKPL